VLVSSGGWEVELRGLDGQVFVFDPGMLCLRFAVTGGEGERAVFETLHGPADVAAWIEEAMGLTAEGVTEADVRDARHVREAIWQCASAQVRGEPLPSGRVEVINAAAGAPPPIPVLDRSRGRRWSQPVTAGQALSAVARDAIDLLSGPSAERLRRCEARDCALLFVDRSRPGQRRWCSMQRCGNRSKVRAYRRRREE
jgi:predicted RNA-binding Zn ribbon-like protein